MTPTTPDAGQRNGGGADFGFWRDHTHINLSPIAAPSILGLFGFAVSTFMVAANMAGWFGDETTTPLILAPFAFAFGGIAQLLAAMWSFRARDALATGIHGAWGSFWIGYGIYQLFVGLGGLPGTSTSTLAATAFGFWFIGLAAVTWTGVFAALAENTAVMLVLLALATGSTLLAIALIADVGTLRTIAAYFLLASAVLAWYTGSAMVLEATYKRVVLPMGKIGAEPNIPGRIPKQVIQYEYGEPGIKVGQ
ncbi:acetate uptake transporter [Amycolatopsis sp. K13G38]|uniref:Acetate uptake transporter n=1 Tax=Amycolatopsis acididurans TaxID=2724524 RepID=A0ABX1JH97_9PSEU|nr:acetate uptake transporter [Amycolatopsis acididurans]NKQ57790.1 acetate uptake transporter [Amycolatopsis acididurans]